MTDENNLKAVTYIIYISAFLVGLWRLWNNNGIAMNVLGACLVSFIGGGIIRGAIAVAFEGEDASETSVLQKVVVFL